MYSALIKSTLGALETNVFYGRGRYKVEDDSWDSIVFGQRRLAQPSSSRFDYVATYFVSIVREEEVEHETVMAVIEAMKGIGFKPSGEAAYTYAHKNQDAVIEVCYLEFSKTIKRVC